MPIVEEYRKILIDGGVDLMHVFTALYSRRKDDEVTLLFLRENGDDDLAHGTAHIPVSRLKTPHDCGDSGLSEAPLDKIVILTSIPSTPDGCQALLESIVRRSNCSRIRLLSRVADNLKEMVSFVGGLKAQSADATLQMFFDIDETRQDWAILTRAFQDNKELTKVTGLVEQFRGLNNILRDGGALTDREVQAMDAIRISIWDYVFKALAKCSGAS